ncbi:MAG: Asp-tRNA(Asn)/Glu-tRNA(Gln) amidotransferase subunit GatC [Gammaproteobacteria bacterium]
MSITIEEVKKIARLSKLGLSQNDAQAYTQDLDNIFKLVEQLKAVDTTGVEALAHPLEAKQRLRADVVTEPDERDTFLSIAPAHAAGMFLVPQVIE